MLPGEPAIAIAVEQPEAGGAVAAYDAVVIERSVDRNEHWRADRDRFQNFKLEISRCTSL